MASANYKLSCVLFGHTLDVRSIAVTQDGYIVSGSRDKCAKVWKPNGVNAGFSEAQTFVGHSNFVSSVCVLPPHDGHPSGLIVTGSNDNIIRAFALDSPTPLLVLKGHNNTACLWKLDGSLAPLATLSGHEAAVWCVVQLRGGDIVTGSADKSIKIWKKDGSFKTTLTGHTDCVRGLAATSDSEFLSCSNDATVRYWDASTGTCLTTLYGHGNFIYSISIFPGGGVDSFVTSSEDRTVKIWQGGECKQTVTLPSQSVWSVACLQNGDIVTGSSDGLVRVFSADSSRQADDALQQQFAEEVANTSVSAEQELGGMKISELPGKEALYEPGRTDGQTKLIREGTKVFCYNWSSASNEWVKVGDVMGASGGTQSTSGKQLFKGKEYDYVFSVDIEDGKPPLKLPYNANEDPWFAAQKFLHDNDLSQLFLDQVANFIINNSKKDVPLGPGPNTDYVDPFTGGNRYIPGGSGGSVEQNAADPFTGASRYLVEVQAQQKLLEFNRKTGDGTHKVQENYLEGVVKLAAADATANPLYMQVLKQLFEWPQDIVFPVLDVTRLAVRNLEINSDLCSGQMGDQLINHLQRFLQPDSLPANQMLSIRTLCNMLTHPEGEALALKHQDYLLSILLNVTSPSSKHMQVALTTLLLNLAVAFNRFQDTVGRARAVDAAVHVIPKLSDSEALFRGLVALGTLIWDADTMQEKSELINTVNSSKELSALLDKLSGGSSMDKVTQCAAQVSALMQV
ncbi:Phospholipase A-2-activating protein [Blattella germanica]|nr:Phospholipase A-2-activating protein [Blattella germanica]